MGSAAHLLLLLLLLALISCSSTAAAMRPHIHVHLAPLGVDQPGCGTETAPCASLVYLATDWTPDAAAEQRYRAEWIQHHPGAQVADIADDPPQPLTIYIKAILAAGEYDGDKMVFHCTERSTRQLRGLVGVAGADGEPAHIDYSNTAAPVVISVTSTCDRVYLDSLVISGAPDRNSQHRIQLGGAPGMLDSAQIINVALFDVHLVIDEPDTSHAKWDVTRVAFSDSRLSVLGNNQISMSHLTFLGCADGQCLSLWGGVASINSVSIGMGGGDGSVSFAETEVDIDTLSLVQGHVTDAALHLGSGVTGTIANLLVRDIVASPQAIGVIVDESDGVTLVGLRTARCRHLVCSAMLVLRQPPTLDDAVFTVDEDLVWPVVCARPGVGDAAPVIWSDVVFRHLGKHPGRDVLCNPEAVRAGCPWV